MSARLGAQDMIRNGFGWVLLAFAALGAILILRYLVRELSFLRFPETQGKMVSCEPFLGHTERVGSRASVPFWTVDVRFTFNVNGTTVEGTHLSNLAPRIVADNWHMADAPPGSILALCSEYGPGTPVKVRYSPTDPETSYIYYTPPLRDWPWAVPPIVAGLVGWFLVFGIPLFRR